MSRDERARALRKKLGSAISDPGVTQGYKGERTLTEWQLDAVMPIVLEALRGASGGGVEDSYIAFQQRRGRLPDLIEEAIEIHRNFMLDDDYDTQRCLDRVIEKLKQARDFYDARAPDHPAENAKSSGEVRAASVAELLEMLSVANQEDGSAIFDHTPDEIGLHVMENHKEILAALARSGKGEG
jgi:hypothetical protein